MSDLDLLQTWHNSEPPRSGAAVLEHPAPGTERLVSMRNQYTPDHEAQARAREMRAAGYKLSEIASELRRAKSTICRWLNPKNAITGLCECGCGTETPVDQNGWRPFRFARGHHTKVPDDALYVIAEGGCWIWQLSTYAKGYGSTTRDGCHAAHRWMYERMVGPVPDGLQIDHLCNNPPCVNPAHMECVTLQENVRRRDLRRKGLPV